MTTETPRIYVANLAAYNNGQLRGEWMDLDDVTDADDLRERIAKMIDCTGGGEEWAIHDYEHIPDGYGEYPDLEKLIELRDAIREHGAELVTAYVNNVGAHYADFSCFADSYLGTYASKEDWAHESLEGYQIDKLLGAELAGYFDYESYADDQELSGYVTFYDVSDGVAVFSNY